MADIWFRRWDNWIRLLVASAFADCAHADVSSSFAIRTKKTWLLSMHDQGKLKNIAILHDATSLATLGSCPHGILLWKIQDDQSFVIEDDNFEWP
jgi:hypothetical protein